MRMVYMFVLHGVEEDIRSDNEEERGAAIAPTNGHSGHDGADTAGGNGKPRSNGKKSKTT